MSNPDGSPNTSKPVVKGKDPHNYRKVGYSMIVISATLVVIGLLVWAIGSNYHYASDIMAGQELGAMTPKTGYNLVSFDYSLPVGSKIKLLDHSQNIDDARNLAEQLGQQFIGQKSQVLIFDTSVENNTNSVSLAEVFAMTPTRGFHIVTINPNFPAGARLSSLKEETLLSNATRDSQSYAQTITDVELQILLLTSSFEENLKQVLGSKYSPDLIPQNINKFKISSTSLASQDQSTFSNGPIVGNQTEITGGNNTGVIKTNSTNSLQIDTPAITNMTLKNQTQSGNLGNPDLGTQENNANATLGNTTTLSLSENLGINGSGK